MNSSGEILRMYVTVSTLHGLYYLGNVEEERIIRFFWLIIFFIAYSFCLYACLYNVKKFYDYEIKNSITATTKMEFKYPSITFCKQFPISKMENEGKNAILFVVAQMFGDTY